jgi:hypothetical protein
MNTKERIIELLASTKREGIELLIKYLTENGFFESPASSKYHGCYAGGLAAHSLGVYELLAKFASEIKLDEISAAGQEPLPILPDTIVVAALLHDVCKIGAYISNGDGWKWNRAQPKGHALLSIERIKKFIVLTELEELMIKFHMGVYGLNEFYKEGDWQSGEYPLRGDDTKTKEERRGKALANTWYHNPIAKMMYLCDELATLHEKMEEK